MRDADAAILPFTRRGPGAATSAFFVSEAAAAAGGGTRGTAVLAALSTSALPAALSILSPALSASSTAPAAIAAGLGFSEEAVGGGGGGTSASTAAAARRRLSTGGASVAAVGGGRLMRSSGGMMRLSAEGHWAGHWYSLGWFAALRSSAGALGVGTTSASPTRGLTDAGSVRFRRAISAGEIACLACRDRGKTRRDEAHAGPQRGETSHEMACHAGARPRSLPAPAPSTLLHRTAPHCTSSHLTSSHLTSSRSNSAAVPHPPAPTTHIARDSHPDHPQGTDPRMHLQPRGELHGALPDAHGQSPACERVPFIARQTPHLQLCRGDVIVRGQAGSHHDNLRVPCHTMPDVTEGHRRQRPFDGAWMAGRAAHRPRRGQRQSGMHGWRVVGG